MNDEELAAVVKESVRGAHMNIPAEQIVRHSRAIRARRRMSILAGGLTAAAAATTAAAVVLAGGPGAVPGQHAAGHARTVVTAAWTVREDADGTVIIYLRQYANPAGLQQTLRADGINAIIRQVPSRTYTLFKRTLKLPACRYAATSNAPPAVQAAVVTLTLPRQGGLAYIIHPDAMPQGSALFLAFLPGVRAVAKNDNTGIIAIPPAVLNNDTVPACVPLTRIMPSSVLKGTT
jgi:hypothetical protein